VTKPSIEVVIGLGVFVVLVDLSDFVVVSMMSGRIDGGFI
jgi:hypothetical protein